MRMKAKHSYFKKISQIGNYINLPYSVAVQHQRLLCASLQGNFLTMIIYNQGHVHVLILYNVYEKNLILIHTYLVLSNL